MTTDHAGEGALQAAKTRGDIGRRSRGDTGDLLGR